MSSPVDYTGRICAQCTDLLCGIGEHLHASICYIYGVLFTNFEIVSKPLVVRPTPFDLQLPKHVLWTATE